MQPEKLHRGNPGKAALDVFAAVQGVPLLIISSAVLKWTGPPRTTKKQSTVIRDAIGVDARFLLKKVEQVA